MTAGIIPTLPTRSPRQPTEYAADCGTRSMLDAWAREEPFFLGPFFPLAISQRVCLLAFYPPVTTAAGPSSMGVFRDHLPILSLLWGPGKKSRPKQRLGGGEGPQTLAVSVVL